MIKANMAFGYATRLLIAIAAGGCGGCGGILLAGDAAQGESIVQDASPEDTPIDDVAREEPRPDDIVIEDVPHEDPPSDEIELPPPRYWSKNFGLNGDELAWCVEPEPDGSFMVLGKSDYSLPEGPAVLLLKLDGGGEPLQLAAFGGEISGFPRELAGTDDGGLVLTGWITSFGPGYQNAWAMKLNPDLSIGWQKAYGNRSNYYAECIRQASAGMRISRPWICPFPHRQRTSNPGKATTRPKPSRSLHLPRPWQRKRSACASRARKTNQDVSRP